MKKYGLLSIAVISALLTGCSKEEPKTVQYYLDHQEEREKTIAECREYAVNISGNSVASQNCRAAHKAVQSKFFEYKPIPKDKTYKSY